MAIKKPDYHSKIILWAPTVRAEASGHVVGNVEAVFSFLPPGMRTELLLRLAEVDREITEMESCQSDE